MSHKHFDDTGHDIIHVYPQRGGATNYENTTAQPVAYVQGNPQYPIYQSFPVATNQGGVDYQFAPQVMVPIPIIVGQDQIHQVHNQEPRRNKRESTDLDYFLSRDRKPKERRYRSRSRSRSAGEISDGTLLDSKRSHRSRSKSVGKIPSNPFRKDRTNQEPTDTRPKNPFRKGKSKSPSPRRQPDFKNRKSRQRSRSHERSSENRFRKRRHDSRDRSSKRHRKRDSPPESRSSSNRTSRRDYRQSESRDRRKVVDSGNKRRQYTEHERDRSRTKHSPYTERVSRAESRISSESYSHLDDGLSLISSRDRYKDDYYQETNKIEPSYEYDETNEQFEYDRQSVISDEFQYEQPKKHSRQSFSPLSDDTHMSDGIRLKIHVSNRGRWIENENKSVTSSSRKTMLMEDGIMIETQRDNFERKSDKNYTRQSSSARYIEDEVEVYYGDETRTRRSYDHSLGMEDVSDSDSYDSQKEFKNARSVRRASQHHSAGDYARGSGRFIGGHNADFKDTTAFDHRRVVTQPMNKLNVPNICIDYNLDKQSCGMQCPYLHLCRFFVLGICKYGEKCKKNHVVFAPQPWNLLRKQNRNLDRSKAVHERVLEILFARFKRNKKDVKQPMPVPDMNPVNIRRSPSVESIVSVESIGTIASIDSFDARYYTADAENLKTKKKEKTEGETEHSEKKLKNESKNKTDDTSEPNDKSENKSRSDVDKKLKESEDCKSVDKQENKTKVEHLSVKAETGSGVDTNEKDKELICEIKIEIENDELTEKHEQPQDEKSKGNSGSKKSIAENNAKESIEKNVKVKSESESVKKLNEQKDVKDKNSDKEGSLSPVSVEIIEDWDTLDKYERISDGGMSDGEKVDINIDDEDLESVSSKESDGDREKALNQGAEMENKVAVPIGMNDPLVFNKSKSGSDNNSETQNASVQNTTNINQTVQNMQPPLFPPVNFNVPPPMLPPRSPFMATNTQPPVRPLFPIINPQAASQSQQTFPVQSIAQSFPNQNLMTPNLRHTVPPPLLPQQGMFVPNVPPPLLPINHLPSPDLMKEVVQTLSEKSENAKKESKAKSKEGKKATVTAKESKKKETKRVDPDLKEPLKSLWQFPHRAMMNMGIIEFVTETEAYKDEMIAEIVKLLIKISLPYVTLKKLMSVIKEKIQINIKTPIDMRKILELYPENFQIVETVDSDDDSDDGEVKKNVQIKSRVKLGFCSKHGYLPFYLGKCDCKQLHLCKFYFLSHCPNMNCKFGHKLRTEHNLNTFKHHRLHRMTGEEIMEFLRDIDCRNIESVPGVCKFYNSSKSREPGCYKGDVTDYQDICHNLHLCFFYVKGNCMVQDCQRSHNIRDKQPLSLLLKFGLDPDEIGEEKIMNLIRMKTVDVKKRKEEKAEVFQNTRQISRDEFKKTFEIQNKVEQNVSKSEVGNKNVKKSKPSGKPSVKFPAVCKFFNNPKGCKKKDWGAAGFCLFLHVCQKYVNGQCDVGEKCKRPHTFFSGEAAALITRYGIDLSRLSEQEILDTLNETRNALTELPMIGDDEDSEDEVDKTEESKDMPKGPQSSANMQVSQGQTYNQGFNQGQNQTSNLGQSYDQGQKSVTPQFSSHSIDEVLQHIMKEGGNKK